MHPQSSHGTNTVFDIIKLNLVVLFMNLVRITYPS